jgi:hypothetical protein
MFALLHRNQGVTILEILVAIFVMLIGVTGVISLFPVGVRLSEMSADDVVSSMTAQHALAAVRCEPELRARLRMYDPDSNRTGDVLGWAADRSLRGVEGLNGNVANVGSPLPNTGLQPAFENEIRLNRTLELHADAQPHNHAIMMMTSGKAKWKIYRLDSGTSLDGFDSTENGCANFPAQPAGQAPGDRIEPGDTFRLIGARSKEGIWATVPAGFFGTPAAPGSGYKLGKGVVDGYGYLAIITRKKGTTDTYRVDILVYKGYDETLPPEGNLPAIACYTTVLSGDMLMLQ